MQDDEPSGIGFGGGRRGSSGGKMTVLTKIIIANIVVYLLQFGFDLFWEHNNPGGSLSREALKNGEVWRLVSYMFVHGNFLHILFNLFGIFMVGRVVLQTLGTKHFLWAYFLGGIGAGLAQVCISPAPIVGASGSLFALMVLFGMILWDTPITALVAFIPVRLRARILVASVIAITVFFFIIDQVFKNGEIMMVSNVAHIAHLGGALVGYYYAKYLNLGGKTPTLSDLQQQRLRNEAKSPRPKKKKWASRLGKEKVAEIVKPSKKNLSEAMDEILEKISASGFQSLTEDEKKILEKGSQELSKKK